MSIIIALLLAAVICMGLFVGCGDNEEAAVNDNPLVVGYSPFSGNFSPFFSESDYDQDVQAMTQLSLLPSDRTGAVIEKGIDGTTIAYNGTDYTYYGPADLDIVENADGTVDYNFKLREDIKFSDGEKLTADDVIFTMYTYADPTYDGPAAFFDLPIKGLDAYRSGMDSRGNVIFAAGSEGYIANDLYTEEEYNTFWDYYNNNAGADFAKEICDYCISKGYNSPTDSVADCAANWKFTLAEDADYQAFWEAIVAAYDTVDEAVAKESAGSDLLQLTIAALKGVYINGVQTGESAANIEGIKKTGDYSFTVSMTRIDATAIYQLAIAIAPLHYYGDTSKFDYNKNKFGFDKGDLSVARSKISDPLGAGAYKFNKYEDGVVYFEANENYYRGVPKTKYVNFKQCQTDEDKLNGITAGTIDITDPSFSTDTVNAIKKANSNGELSGDKIKTITVDNLGYGYIGMCANVMNVGGIPDSAASKNLRKAFGTIFSVYREVAIDTYFGDRASVINYPISNTSWAAPQPTDDGYKVAFSVDKDGNDIFTSDMSAEDKYAAAKTAALGFLEAAGYTVDGGRVTAAPEGAALEYTACISATSSGDHPSFMILEEANKAFAEIGITLIINNIPNISDLWDALIDQEVAIWCAAWDASVDSDMYQVYFSGDETRAAGGFNYIYAIDDADLNKLILDSKASTDLSYRKRIYKSALDIIIDWAVVIPVYQRQNAIIFSSERVDLNTVTPDITTFYGWMSEIENTVLK